MDLSDGGFGVSRRSVWAVVTVVAYVLLIAASAAAAIRGITLVVAGHWSSGVLLLAAGLVGAVIIALVLAVVFTRIGRSAGGSTRGPSRR